MEAYLTRKYRTVIKSLGLRSSRHADTDIDTDITDTDRQVLIVDRSRSSLSDTVDSTDVRRRIIRRLTPASVSRCRSVTEQTSRCDGREALDGVLQGALNVQLRRPRRRRPRSDVDELPSSRVVTRCASTPELMSVVASANCCHHQQLQQRRKSVDVVSLRVCARPEPEAAGIVTSERNVASTGGTIRKRLERLRQRVFARKSSTSTTKTSSTEHSYYFNFDEQRPPSTEELSHGRPSRDVITGQLTIQRKSASSRDRQPPSSSSSSCTTLSSTRSRDSPPNRLTFLHEKSSVRRAASSAVHDSTRAVLERTLNFDGSCGSRLVGSDVTAEQRRRSASLMDVTTADTSVIRDVTATRIQRTCFPAADGLPRDLQSRTSRDSSRTHLLEREREDPSNSPSRRHLIVLDRGEDGRQKLGFTVVGGRDTSRGPMGVYVKTVFVGGLAAEPGGLRQGDEIESVNAMPLCGLSHQDAVDVFKQCRRGRVCLVVKRRENSTNSDISSQLTAAATTTTTVTNDYKSTRNVSLQVPTEPRFHHKDRHFPAVILLQASTTSTCDVTSSSALLQDQRETSSLASVNDIAGQSLILPSVLLPRSSGVTSCGTTQTAADAPRRPQRRRTDKLKLPSSCEQLTLDAERLQKREEINSETGNFSFRGLETSDCERDKLIQNMNSVFETNENLLVTVMRSTCTTFSVITLGNHRHVEIFPLLLKPRFTAFDHCALAFRPSSLADVFTYCSTLEMFGTIVFTDYSDAAPPEAVSSIGNEAGAIGLISATSDINKEQVQSFSSNGEDDLTVTSYYRLISNNNNVNCRREYRLRSAKHFSSNFSSEFSADWNRAEPEIANGDVMHRTSAAAVDRNQVISHWRRTEPEILLHTQRRRRSVLV